MRDRERDLAQLYTVLEQAADGPVLLPHSRVGPNASGVYFFFESGEVRRNGCPRVVRVGRSGNLRSRLLNQHLHGTHRDNCYDDHGLRSSVFRHHIGLALIVRDKLFLGERTPEETANKWRKFKKVEPSSHVERDFERDVERRVTRVLSAMSVAWIVTSEHARIEKHLIALLSSADSPSGSWLGLFHSQDEIRQSGLWNVTHVGEGYDRDMLDLLRT